MIPSTRMRPLLLTGLLLTAALAASAQNSAAATLYLTGPAGTEVFVDGGAVGFLPMDGPLELPTGRYVIRCELPGHQPYETTLRFLSAEDGRRLQVRLMPLRRRTALLSNVLFAGLGQHYVGQSTRGWIYNAIEAGGLLTALGAELRRSDFRKDYLLLMDRYDQEINADQIAYYEGQALAAYADMEDMEDLRTTGLVVAGGAVLLSLIDSLAFFPSFEVGPGLPTAWNTPDRDDSSARPRLTTAVHLGYRRTF